MPSYRDYPAVKPFINSEYQRDPSKYSYAYPESHRSGQCRVRKGTGSQSVVVCVAKYPGGESRQ